MKRERRERVMITGVGAITPIGLTAPDFWQSCLLGRSGVRRIEAFDPSPYPCQIAGEAWGFDPLRTMSAKEASRAARFVQLAVAASDEAIRQAELSNDDLDATRFGIVWGNGSGGAPAIDALLPTVDAATRWSSAEPLALLKVIPDSAATALAIRLGAHGPVSTVVAACVSSTLAIAQAAHLVRNHEVDVALAGGSEAWITPMGIGSFCLLHALSVSRNHCPAAASRPFDRSRDGFVPAEGAGALVVESEAHARSRGALPIAEIAGVGITNDAHHAVAPRADGREAARAISLALADADMSAGDIDYVNAHGTSTPLNDVAETRALKQALGTVAYRVPVSATKSMTGHGLAASGAWEAVAAALSIRDGVVHPTINLDEPDDACDLDYVRDVARSASVHAALKVSFGFGGQNVALVLRGV